MPSLHMRSAALLCLIAAAVWSDVLGAQQPADSARPRPVQGDTTRRPAPADTTHRPAAPTTRPAADTAGPRPELKPPLSPRRAFLYSLVLPGYAQSILGRNRAGALEVAFEAVALTMVRISAADVREARRLQADSIPVSFVDATGAPVVRYERTGFPASLIRVRRAHLEDWIAVLVGNHLFSGADAFVAANLWDLPTEISVRGTPGAAQLALRLRW